MSPATCGRGLKQQRNGTFFRVVQVARHVRAWIETSDDPRDMTLAERRPPRAGVD